MKGYEFHPEAQADLDAIWDYIAADNPAAADHVVDQIEEALDRLISFPESGSHRPDLTMRELRFAEAGNYLIAYAPDQTPLWVLGVMHGSRSPRIMAKVLRGRG